MRKFSKNVITQQSTDQIHPLKFRGVQILMYATLPDPPPPRVCGRVWYQDYTLNSPSSANGTTPYTGGLFAFALGMYITLSTSLCCCQVLSVRIPIQNQSIG